VPGHADEQTTIVAEISGPELLRVGHQSVEIFLEAPVVQGLEGCGIVEILALGVGGISVLAQNIQLQAIRPPVSVARRKLVGGNVRRTARNHTECHLQQHCSSCVQRDIHSCWILGCGDMKQREKKLEPPQFKKVTRVDPIMGRVLSSLLIWSFWALP
jgi:hypothetical protein